ncbi:MAG TPA: hypothetical protein PLM14_14890 [Candidatus Hydrogenedentes bacterium]|nr:hypothetical protein [Candidatus Hydrogenedentota bacterium]
MSDPSVVVVCVRHGTDDKRAIRRQTWVSKYLSLFLSLLQQPVICTIGMEDTYVVGFTNRRENHIVGIGITATV